MRNIIVPVVAGPVDLTSPFMASDRADPHHGADFFPVPRGRKLPILAYDCGTVIFAQLGKKSAGNWLEIRNDNGLTSTYMHLDGIVVATGQRVQRAARIGTMGATGDSTGVHLHFELRWANERGGGKNAVDPMPFLLSQNQNASGGCLRILQRPSPNHTAGRQGHVPDIIVCHITNGNFPGSIDWATNPASQVSYHFMVSNSGEVTQCVDIADTAWANGTSVTAGDSRHSRNSALAIVRERGGNANNYSTSIGFEGVHNKTNGRLTPAQLDAAVRLIGHIRSEVNRIFEANIPIARAHIVGHFEITPLTRPDCPGAGFPFDEIMRRLAAEDGGLHGQASAAPQPAQNAGPPYRVRVGSFADRRGAEEKRSELIKSGHGDAFIVQDGGKWRVQVASGPNLDGAESLAETLRAQGFGDVGVF